MVSNGAANESVLNAERRNGSRRRLCDMLKSRSYDFSKENSNENANNNNNNNNRNSDDAREDRYVPRRNSRSRVEHRDDKKRRNSAPQTQRSVQQQRPTNPSEQLRQETQSSRQHLRNSSRRQKRPSHRVQRPGQRAQPKGQRSQSNPEKKQQQQKKKKQQQNQQRQRRGRSRIAFIQSRIDLVLKETERDEISVLGKYTCRNVLYFVIAYSVVLCLRSAVEVYTEGVVQQLEQKYYFSRASLGILSGVKLIGLLASLVFVAFFARASHKPLLILVGVLICCLGTIIWPVPYFIDGQSQSSYSDAIMQCDNQPSLGFFYSEMCRYQNRTRATDLNLPNTGVCSACVLRRESSWWDARELRFSVMCLAGFLIGVGTGLFATLGILYVEESGEDERRPLYYGIIMSMMGLGQFLGSCMAWSFLGYSENLSVKEKLMSWEIRAWWLGMVLLCIFLFLMSWCFLVFPKAIVPPFWVVAERHKKLKYYNLYLNYLQNKIKEQKNPEPQKKHRTSSRSKNPKPAEGFPSTVETVVPDSSVEVQGKSGTADVVVPASSFAVTGAEDKQGNVLNIRQLMTSTVEINDPNEVSRPRTKPSKKPGNNCLRLKDLFKTPGFTLVLIAVCLGAYFPGGYRTVMATYVHHNFQQPSLSSWFYTMGLSYSLAWSIGPGLGGLIIYLMKLTLKKQLTMVLFLISVHVIFFFFMLPISCNSRIEIFSNVTTSCLNKCGCNYVQMEPVCTSSGALYNSPCHASCSINSTCSCTDSSVSSDNCIGNCPIYGLYWVFLFVSTISFSAASVSIILFFLRTAKEEEKTLSLSVAFLVIILAAYVPGAAVYSGIANSSCIEYRQNCLSENLCVGYNLESFRYFIHGSNIAFLAGSFFIFLLVSILSSLRRITFDEESADGKAESVHEDSEVYERRETSAARISKKTDPWKMQNRPAPSEGESQEDKLRSHLQFIEQMSKKGSSEVFINQPFKEPSDPKDQPKGHNIRKNRSDPSLLDNNRLTDSNDSSTKQLIDSKSKQKPSASSSVPTPPIQLPETLLSNREMVENYLSTIPDDIVFERPVSLESEASNHSSRSVPSEPSRDVEQLMLEDPRMTGINPGFVEDDPARDRPAARRSRLSDVEATRFV